eukprot:1746603-Rhodomonas_salina.1
MHIDMHTHASDPRSAPLPPPTPLSSLLPPPTLSLSHCDSLAPPSSFQRGWCSASTQRVKGRG